VSAQAYFATRLAPDPRREKLWRYLTDYLARYVPRAASVLELGAGYCYFINRVPAGRRVAVDISPDMLGFKGADVEGIVGDALEFLRGTAPGQFDFILASNFFEHFEWPALNEMLPLIARALKPGGRLAVIQPNFRLSAARYFDDYTHRTIFTDVSLPDWLTGSGLEVIRNEPRFLPLTVKSRMGAFTFLVPLYLRMPVRPLAGQMFVLAQKAAGDSGSSGLTGSSR
jgi:SAM-dependent methyltransferase